MHRSVTGGRQQQQAPYSRDLGSGPRRVTGGGAPRRWLGSRGGSRLHPILLIPVFLSGAFLAPWLGLTTSWSESTRTDVLPEPVYQPPDRDWTPQKVLAPADAPPLRRDDDDDDAAYAPPPPPPPNRRGQPRDWETYDGSDDDGGGDGGDSYLVHAGLLYFRTSPALIPEHRLERPIPIAPARPPRNNYHQAPPIPDSAALTEPPPPAPRDWLVPGELFAHPPSRRKHLTPPPPNPNLNLAAAVKPKPVVRAPVPPARQPPPPPEPQREDEHNGHVLGPNAAAMARAKREGRPFVPGTPAELLEKVRAHRQKIQDEINAERRKAEEPLIRQRQQELLLRQEAEADRRKKQQQQQQAAMRPGLGLRKIDTDGKAPPAPPVGEANLLWGDDNDDDDGLHAEDDDQYGSSAVEEDDLALLAAIRALTPAELRDLSPDERQLVAELEETSRQQQQQHRDSNGQGRGGGAAAAGAGGGAGAGQRRGAWNARAGARARGGGGGVPPAAAAAQGRKQQEVELKGAGGGGGGGGNERQKQMAALRGGRPPPPRREKRALQEEEEAVAEGEQQQQQQKRGAAVADVVVVVDHGASANLAAVVEEKEEEEEEEGEEASVAGVEGEPNKVDGDHQDRNQDRPSLTRRASIPVVASSADSDRLHPITHLIAEAEQAWENTLRRQSQSLEQAVREYKRRYKMNPPAGFDSW